ncbi:MAG: flagellar biosynthesis protein FlhB [Candidatus Eisenbacteria sp.]|nr:flagellar biosynthesis protein FlhB [Candidatus Eisenbacteria bacterium]
MSDKGEKTEQPTGRRRTEARRKGDLIKSTELKSAIMVLVGVATLKFAGPWMKRMMMERFQGSFAGIAETEVTGASMSAILASWGSWMGELLIPILAVLFFGGILVGALVQGGFVFTTQPLALNLSRLNPVTGAKNLISGQTFFRLFRDTVKVVLIGYVCYQAVRDAMAMLLELTDVHLAQTMSSVSDLVISLALRAGFVLLILGIIDYVFMRRKYFKDLKMTKREVKDEFKQMEGDPLVKGKIRGLQRDLARRRMMQAVPNADVVLTNPTRVAVALKYDPEAMGAPTVVAKGQRLVAEKIKAIARQFDVPVVEDKFLARSLFNLAEVGEQIPEELYRAVAAVLSYVYRLKGKLSPLGQKA